MEQLNWYIEVAAVVLGLIYLFLMIAENIWCWIFGIISSALSIYLFYETKLYSEAILYTYYVGIGIYGWINWKKKQDKKQKVPVVMWDWKRHLFLILTGISVSTTLGYIFKSFTDANNPFEDAFSTVFAFIASYLEAQKVLEGWIYWIILNAFSVYLYTIRGLDLYGYLMIIYFVFSFVGAYTWHNTYRKQKNGKLNLEDNLID